MERRNFLASSLALGLPSLAFGPSDSQRVSPSSFAWWYCDLNCWKWPKAWGNPPKDFKRMQKLPGRAKYAEFNRLGYGRLTDALQRLATKKECLRVWNVEYKKNPMTQAEFDRWWSEIGVENA